MCIRFTHRVPRGLLPGRRETTGGHLIGFIKCAPGRGDGERTGRERGRAGSDPRLQPAKPQPAKALGCKAPSRIKPVPRARPGREPSRGPHQPLRQRDGGEKKKGKKKRGGGAHQFPGHSEGNLRRLVFGSQTRPKGAAAPPPPRPFPVLPSLRPATGPRSRLSRLSQHRHQQQQRARGVNPAAEQSEEARAAEGISGRSGLHSGSREKEHAETIISWEKLKPNENLLCRLYSDNQPFCG